MKIIEEKLPQYIDKEQTCDSCKTRFIVEKEDIDNVRIFDGDEYHYQLFGTYDSYFINCPICHFSVLLKTK